MNGDEPKTIRLVEDRWTVLRHVIEAAAIVTAGLWAFYTFVYQEKLRPAAEPAALTPTISIQRLGRDRKREILDVTIRLANTGRTDLDIAADAWNIWGYRYASSVSKRGDTGGWYRTARQDMPLAIRERLVSFAELRDPAVGGRRGLHITIEPGTASTLWS